MRQGLGDNWFPDHWSEPRASTSRVAILAALFTVAVLPSVSAQWVACTGQATGTNCTSANVGVGTTNPTATLHVAGSSVETLFASNSGATTGYSRLSVKNDIGQGPIFLSYGSAFPGTSTFSGLPWANLSLIAASSATGVVIENAATAPLLFAIHDAEKMRIDTNGNVGIGTTTPNALAKLDVNGAIYSTSLYVKSMQSTNTRFQQSSDALQSGLFVVGSDFAASGGYLSFNRQSGLNSYGSLQVGDNNAYRSLSLNPNGGLVGIGTATPLSLLHLLSPAAANTHSYLTIENANAGLQSALELKNSATGTDWIQYIPGSSADLRFYRSGDMVTFAGNGNVGVGTTTPQAPLHIYSNATNPTNDLFLIEGPGNAPAYGLVIKGGAGPTAAIRAKYTNPSNTTASEVDFYTNPVGGTNNLQARMVIDGFGNVGIGTSAAPAAKLDVNGNINSSGSITVAGNINAKYQDVAEWVATDGDLLPGTVVVVSNSGRNRVAASSHPYDTSVAGVVSAQPGITLGEAGPQKATIATTGRVLVAVDATTSSIHQGDLLVTSSMTGMAMKSEPITMGGRSLHQPGTIIGKALEPLESGYGMILVLLTLQ